MGEKHQFKPTACLAPFPGPNHTWIGQPQIHNRDHDRMTTRSNPTQGNREDPLTLEFGNTASQPSHDPNEAPASQIEKQSYDPERIKLKPTSDQNEKESVPSHRSKETIVHDNNNNYWGRNVHGCSPTHNNVLYFSNKDRALQDLQAWGDGMVHNQPDAEIIGKKLIKVETGTLPPYHVRKKETKESTTQTPGCTNEIFILSAKEHYPRIQPLDDT